VNTYAEGGATACVDCPSGRQSGLGSSECGYCMQGQYQTLDDAGEKICLDCSNGTASSVGLTCVDCGPGYYTADSVDCVVCEPGGYSSSDRNVACAPCPAGRYSGSGQSECSACAPGSYQPARGRTSCVLADPGYYVSDMAAIAEAACPPGNSSGSGALGCDSCEVGTYSYKAASASCLLCAFPLATTATTASFCDGCVAGYYWSDDAHSAFLESDSHEDGTQCADCCKACVDGMECDSPGLTVETIVVAEGYWRGSTRSVAVEGCVRRANCPGSGSASLGGDALCGGRSEGVRCNECRGGSYLGADGECFSCGSSPVCKSTSELGRRGQT
jgi:hypothetical protein